LSLANIRSWNNLLPITTTNTFILCELHTKYNSKNT